MSIILNPFILFLTCNLSNVPIFVPIPNTVPLDPKPVSFIFVPNILIFFLLFLREETHKKNVLLVVGPLRSYPPYTNCLVVHAFCLVVKTRLVVRPLKKKLLLCLCVSSLRLLYNCLWYMKRFVFSLQILILYAHLIW